MGNERARVSAGPIANAVEHSTASSREIHLGWDIGDNGLRRLTAECDDEITSWTFAGPALFDESNMEELLAGDLGAMAVADHQAQCTACRSWIAGRSS